MGFLTDITDSVGLTDTGAGDRAAEAQAAAMREANAMLQNMYGESKERFSPYLQQGQMSLGQLAQLSGSMPTQAQRFTEADFQEDPGYQHRLAEGQKAIERSAAARGGLGGGKTLKALQRYGQGMGAQEYGASRNRFLQDQQMDQQFRQAKMSQLGQLAGMGQGAAGSLSNMGAGIGGQMGQNIMGVGQQRANAELARGQGMKDLWQMGMQGAAMACWVARAIFGEENPKWLMARNYVLNIGPKWFRDFYLKHGENFAKKVEKSKTLKIILKPLFEYFAFRGRKKLEVKYA
ncbi:MAG: hypothetical protein ACPG5Z_00220 [Pseudoalteromonas sp.]